MTSESDDAWGITAKHILRTQDRYINGHNSAKTMKMYKKKYPFRRSEEVGILIQNLTVLCDVQKRWQD